MGVHYETIRIVGLAIAVLLIGYGVCRKYFNSNGTINNIFCGLLSGLSVAFMVTGVNLLHTEDMFKQEVQERVYEIYCELRMVETIFSTYESVGAMDKITTLSNERICDLILLSETLSLRCARIYELSKINVNGHRPNRIISNSYLDSIKKFFVVLNRINQIGFPATAKYIVIFLNSSYYNNNTNRDIYLLNNLNLQVGRLREMRELINDHLQWSVNIFPDMPERYQQKIANDEKLFEQLKNSNRTAPVIKNTN